MIRVLIVDDHAVVRQGLLRFLELRDDSSPSDPRGIADELVIDEKTVKTHVSSILSKLHLEDRTQAAIRVLRHGLAADEG